MVKGFPFLDWNGDGKVDPLDIAISMGIMEAEEDEDDDFFA